MCLAKLVQRFGTFAAPFSVLIALSGCAVAPPPVTKYVVVNSVPQQAALEIGTENDAFHLVGITPVTISVPPGDAVNPRTMCLFRLTAPGYYKAEKAYPRATLPAEIVIPLEKVK
jgi:hypothetical protein